MKVEIISNEIIKPSSPTPDHLRQYQLSFLDQLSPRSYTPFLYYYDLNYAHSADDSDFIADVSDKLKKSLSEALTGFYPLAGRLISDQFLGCSDEGIVYLEARVKSKLSEVVVNPIPPELNKLLSFELDEIAELPLGVQLINTFECRGIAIGLCFSHRITNALSRLMFIKSWMAIARGEKDAAVRPEFVSATLFPPRDIGEYDTSFTIAKKDTVITKRFVFAAASIQGLRGKYEQNLNGEITNPNRPLSPVEIVSAFIWSRFAKATKSDQTKKFHTIHHAVNLRPKLDPPLPLHSFGNYYRPSTMIPSSSVSILICNDNVGEDCSFMHGLARKMGEDIRKIDNDFVENIRKSGDEFVENLKKGAERLVQGNLVLENIEHKQWTSEIQI
ncbi:hypothetical protein TIFTF001_018289 [Ficus carica]|uniref:Uncharacterized protein n=1 Tax=Ficus carica TaxID=3494 RepID=A0AA88AVC8_FICCA|nr:hypothetical protein TIFTF001_018289 [Ficus carica]